MARITKPTPEMVALLRKAGSNRYDEAIAAQREIASAVTLPLQKGVMDGDITAGIFLAEEFEQGAAVEYPLDFLSPGDEKFFKAYTVPNHGALPERKVEGDYLAVSTYDVGNEIGCNLKYLRQARWPVF